MTASLIERARKLIPLATQTSSKAACRFAEGFGPTHIAGGRGALVFTEDGRNLIDWAMGLGCVILGHGNSEVTVAVNEAARDGISHTLPTHYEVAAAERLHDWLPGADMVRFLKTGSDACSAAVRLARAFTGRDLIVRCGYHGWHDWAMNADYAEKLGIPQCVRDLTRTVPFNDLEALEDEFLRACWNGGVGVAAFILEPCPIHPPADWYLPRVRDLCTRYGVVLIFDEVISGIRMARGGAAEHYNVTPDLVCLGKGLANGFPLAAVCGRRDLMEMFRETHISGTYNGETASLAAALTTMRILDRADFWEHQRQIGLTLRHGYEAMVEEYQLGAYTRIVGNPHHTVIQWNEAPHETLFQQEMIREGILYTGSQFPCLAHTREQVQKTREAYRIAGGIVAAAIKTGSVMQSLSCQVNRPIFTRNR